MTKASKKRLGVGAALVVVLSGVTALSEVGHEPRADQTLQSPRITSRDDDELISWLSTTTLPMLHDGRALPNMGRQPFELMPPLIVRGASSPAT